MHKRSIRIVISETRKRKQLAHTNAFKAEIARSLISPMFFVSKMKQDLYRNARGPSAIIVIKKFNRISVIIVSPLQFH
jgi:hypothetical protein